MSQTLMLTYLKFIRYLSEIQILVWHHVFLATVTVIGRFGPFHSWFLKYTFKNTFSFTSGWGSQASCLTSNFPQKKYVHYQHEYTSDEYREMDSGSHSILDTPIVPILPSSTSKYYCPLQCPCPRKLCRLQLIRPGEGKNV